MCEYIRIKLIRLASTIRLDMDVELSACNALNCFWHFANRRIVNETRTNGEIEQNA